MKHPTRKTRLLPTRSPAKEVQLQSKPSSRPTPPPESANQEPEIILLAVIGMSPAVLTETVWALAHESSPVIPHRIVVLTTSEGRRQIEQRLFHPLPRFHHLCAWDALRQSLQTEGHDLSSRLRFGSTGDDVRILTRHDRNTGHSVELSDIRSPEDNEAASDFMLEQVRSIVENPDTQLIASIAGGRKTMGALLYACMTLLGRETDRLTHVLVSDPFESVREFYFPNQPGGPLARPELPVRNPETTQPTSEPPLSPSAAVVDLADVPFVPLRNLFARELGRKAGTFSRLVADGRETIRNRAVEHLRLSLDSHRSELELNGRRIKLAPMEMLLMLFLARRAKQREPVFAAYKDAVDPLNAFRLELRNDRPKDNFGDWRHADALSSLWEEREITKTVSSLREKLRRVGPDASILVNCLPEKGRCSLDLPGELIHLK